MTRWRVHGRLVKQTGVSTVEKTLKKALCLCVFVCVPLWLRPLKEHQPQWSSSQFSPVYSEHLINTSASAGGGSPHFAASQIKTIPSAKPGYRRGKFYRGIWNLGVTWSEMHQCSLVVFEDRIRGSDRCIRFAWVSSVSGWPQDSCNRMQATAPSSLSQRAHTHVHVRTHTHTHLALRAVSHRTSNRCTYKQIPFISDERGRSPTLEWLNRVRRAQRPLVTTGWCKNRLRVI